MEFLKTVHQHSAGNLPNKLLFRSGYKARSTGSQVWAFFVLSVFLRYTFGAFPNVLLKCLHLQRPAVTGRLFNRHT